MRLFKFISPLLLILIVTGCATNNYQTNFSENEVYGSIRYGYQHSSKSGSTTISSSNGNNYIGIQRTKK